ncbi:Ditrans,polycis-undecaprenyl-diphosphate synthase ((2E,6E)-farnesyl-diphosphate specific) [Sinobacterium norvegicum]|uniref:Ditrans,polycis-undecaprenyl-diphosphate synthase ((2E,6E)-farnesyl-diphosphate specific) n=1 Tax=Sinobacterium norvegicum TaxID=1641715 RepID=A0ABN8EFE0_9GAMM|nr:isoprenyl transferase [Sinobacterium norvegicum]CAH0990709.1 Ditrans,polycis-undecaprenyl-diphosphate synthase ((2E,6E)-farnesyl-diphosphate specific) [Sinobacterium norvegicum]
MAGTVEILSPEQVKNVPKHIAIIMDGNNRWAKKQGILKAAAGHKAGVEAIRGVLNACDKFDVDVLTLFAFSSENWLRPKHEVSALMSLFSSYLKKEVPELHKNNVRLRVVGRRDRFSSKLCQQIVQAEQLTVDNSGRTLVIAADYGGKWDVASAAKSLAKDVEAGLLSADSIDESMLAQRMSLSDLIAPDLLIRTGGEMRISNYLLWQCAYSEFYFTETYWPDFGEQALRQAIAEFAGRQRRFGKTSEQIEQEDACLSNV